jgi:LCP family protein required for cell wall assembly
VGSAGDVRRRSETVRFRRSLTLLVMTLFMPGSAQLVTGNKQIGRIAVRIFLGLLVLLAFVLLFLGKDGMVGLAVRPWFLSVVRIAAFVLGVGWLLLFLDAWRLGRPLSLERNHRLVSSGLATLLGLAACAPLFYAAHLAGIQRDLLGSLFPKGDLGALDDGRLNVLLLGGDAGKGREGVRTDSITLASVDVASGKAVMFGLPRNLQKAPFPDGTPAHDAQPGGFPDFLFGVYRYGEQNKELFPGAENPGAEAIKQAVSATLGLKVHYYVLVNLDGFRQLVDALGGVTIRVDERLPIGGVGPGGERTPVTGYVEPGLQKLDGYHALWYARSRRDSSDYDRMARQRCMMGAILREADPLNVLRRYQALAESTKALIETDIPRGALTTLVGVAEKTQQTKVASVQIVQPLIDPADPDIAVIHAKVDQTIEKSKRPVQAKPKASGSGGSGASSATASGSSGGSGDSGDSSNEEGRTKAEAASLDEVCRYS